MNRTPNQLHATLYMKGNDMKKEYKKTVVVTSDNSGKGLVCVWTEIDLPLHKDSCGIWLTQDADGPTNRPWSQEDLTAKAFKSIYGFTPRKGSKETIEIIVRRLK